jgi:hypothetical protein
LNDTEQATDRAAGSVPNAFRNALFWRWAPAMPKGLPSAFVTLLYALSAAADPTGKLKFRDGTVIRIKDIAAATKTDEKDCRRYIGAAIAAGVLTVEGERKRGKAALYVLLVTPVPSWEAAVASLETTRRRSRKAPPWLITEDDENGGVGPGLSEDENGAHAPELPDSSQDREQGTRPRMGSGDTPPFGSGHTPPNNPGSTHGVSHDGAEVVPQPQVDPASEDEEPIFEDPNDEPDAAPDGADDEHQTVPVDFRRCARCHSPMAPRPGRTLCAACTRDQPRAHPGAA